MIALRAASVAIPALLWAVADTQASKRLSPTASLSIAFESYELYSIGDNSRKIRTVHPDLHGISGWISSVGASVALFDADGDGLANDYCLVDPRFDTVTVAPVPTTGARFAPFEIRWTERSARPSSVAPMGCLAADLDFDTAQDLVLYYWGRGPSLHLAAENYDERPLLPQSEMWNTNAAIVADVDGDGMLDLVFGNYFPENAEILGAAGMPRMQHSMSRAGNGGRNRILRATGAGSFKDASEALDVATLRGWTLALGAADLDGDLLPELYVANDFGPDDLLHNRSAPGAISFERVVGTRKLTDPRSRVLGRDSFKGMGVDFGDIDRDGLLDIYVSNISEDYALMESHFLFRGTGDTEAFARGHAPFEEVSGRTGVARSSWGWDARFVDFDGDGWTEILQATGFIKGEIDHWSELHEVAMGNDELLKFPSVWPVFGPGDGLSGDRADALFVRQSDGRWREAGLAAGFGLGTITRGVAVGDVDGDGDVDAVLARQWEPSVLLLNVSEQAAPTAAFDLQLELPNGSTRPAIGASVLLRSSDGSGPRYAAVVPGGNGHSGKSAPEVYFGLGSYPADTTLVADIAWRDAEGTHSTAIPVTGGRQSILLADGEATIAD